MTRRVPFLLVLFATLLAASPGWAFELPAQKLELIDNLRRAAERGDAERFTAYLGLLKAETGAFEQAFQVALPANPAPEQLQGLAGVLLAGWAFLMTDTLATTPDAPDSAWRVVSILLARDKDWMVESDPKLFNQFQRAISELRVLSDEGARTAIRTDLQKRVTELVARSLKAS